MNILNFIKKNRNGIIRYCISGVLLAIVIPKTIDYQLKKYENHEVSNRFIYEQGIKPYRNKLVECQRKNSELISKIGEQIDYWSLLTKLSEKSFKIDQERFLPNSSENIKQYLLKKAFKDSSRIIIMEKQLDYCLRELINSSGEVAIMLNVIPSYQKIYQQISNTEKNLSQKRDIQLKTYLSKRGLPHPGVFRDMDLFNKYLIYFEKNPISDYKILGFNIKMLGIMFDFNKKSYEAHSLFYTQTNQLFLSTYQRQLG